jgi:hypothetical protein
MLTLRTPQLRALRRTAADALLDQATALVHRHWRARSEALGAAATRQRVKGALRQAWSYGFTTRREALRFVNLTMALGDGFVTDPRYPWAAELLARGDLHPVTRLDLLCEQASLTLRYGGPGA